MSFLHALWPFVWHYGIGASVIAGAAALWFFTAFKKLAICIAIFVAALLVGYTIGGKDGKHYVQAIWDARELATQKAATDARSSAELAIPPAGPDVPLPPGKRVCNDRYDRDCS